MANISPLKRIAYFFQLLDTVEFLLLSFNTVSIEPPSPTPDNHLNSTDTQNVDSNQGALWQRLVALERELQETRAHCQTLVDYLRAMPVCPDTSKHINNTSEFLEQSSRAFPSAGISVEGAALSPYLYKFLAAKFSGTKIRIWSEVSEERLDERYALKLLRALKDKGFEFNIDQVNLDF